MTKLKIFNFDYYNILENKEDPELECPIFVACGRDEDGKFHSIKIPGNKGLFRPHFFVKDNYTNKALIEELQLEYEEWPYPTAYDETERVLIVYTQFPFQVAQIRHYFENTYEADVKYAKMFMMKLGLDGAFMEIPDNAEWITVDDVLPIPEEEHFQVEPRIFYVDIETDFFDPSKSFDLFNCFIISLGVYDNYTNEYTMFEWSPLNQEMWHESKEIKRTFKHPDISPQSFLTIIHCSSEKQLLTEFFKLFRRHPDAISTFNGHGGYELQSYKSKSRREWSNGFDEPVIFIRAKELGLLKEIQLMSPLPRFKNKFGHYYGVYKRGQKDKFEVVFRGLTSLDFYYAEPLMKYTEKYRNFFGRSLDAYLKFFGKHGKVEHEGLSVAEFKKQDLYKELEYNRIDVEGTMFLDKKFGFSNDIFETVTLSKVPGNDVLSATKIHDMITLDFAQDKVVFDTKYQKWSRNLWKGWLRERHGGYVVPVKKGIGGWTAIIDFSQLYPNIAIAVNAGVDTLIQVAEEHPDYYIDKFGKKWMKKECYITPSAPFRSDKVSIEKQIWEKLLAYRQKYKDILSEIFDKTGGNTDDPLYKLYWSKQYNLKTRVVNNKYGASGNPASRTKCLPVYNCMPSIAQLLLQGLEQELLPKLGYKDRGGDTDSIFVALKSTNLEDAIKESETLVAECNIFVDNLLRTKFNIKNHNIKMDWEKIGPKFYAHMKKNYLMEVWAEGGKVLPEKNRYIMYVGFEMKKGNRADITELVQRVYFKTVLESKDKDEFLEKITQVIKRINEIFPSLPWHKISPRINIRRKLEEYKPNYFARRAAELSNKVLNSGFTNGSHGFLGWMNTGSIQELQTVLMFRKKDLKHSKFQPRKEWINGNLEFLPPEIELDYKTHKKKFVIKKLDLLLDDYNTGYWQIYRASRITSPMVL